MFVQDEPLRANYLLISAEIPDDISRQEIDPRQLPENWRTLEERETLHEIGSQWLRDGKCWCWLSQAR